MLKKPSSGVLAGHCRLTISAAFTDVPRFIQRGVNLRGSTYHRVRAAKSSSGRVGEKEYAPPFRHWTLTNLRPSANVRLLLRRLADVTGPCLWKGASWRAGAGRVRTKAFLNILREYQ